MQETNPWINTKMSLANEELLQRNYRPNLLIQLLSFDFSSEFQASHLYFKIIDFQDVISLFSNNL